MAPLVGENCCLVYCNYVHDVVPLALELREHGLKSASYQDIGMSHHDKESKRFTRIGEVEA